MRKMPERDVGMPAYFVPAILAADGGVFEWDVRGDRLCCCRNAAGMHGLSEAEAQEGVPLSRIAASVHPDDRAGFLDRVAEKVGASDLIVLDYRTVPAAGGMRHLQVRGRYETNAAGATVSGRGIVLDVTAPDADGDPEGSVLPSQKTVEAATALDEVTAHAIAARIAIDRVDGPAVPTLRQAANLLLWALGRTLAQRLRD